MHAYDSVCFLLSRTMVYRCFFTRPICLLCNQARARFILLSIFLSLVSLNWIIGENCKRNITSHREREAMHVLHEAIDPNENEIHPNFERKRILLWNKVFNEDNIFGIELSKDILRTVGCSVWQCDIITDRNSYAIESYDAVIFNQRQWTPMDLPPHRSAHQRYIFWINESPGWRYANTYSMTEYFNWTMTYRWDSDIVQTFGRVTLINSTVSANFSNLQTINSLLGKTKDSTNYAIGKSKKVAWLVSSSKSLSGRNQFVRQLKKFISVDRPNMKCAHSNSEIFHRMLERDYKFYLSLENTLCNDYITDLLFAQIHYNIVPIVFDLHGHYKRLAPLYSFINAADFKSVKLLESR